MFPMFLPLPPVAVLLPPDSPRADAVYEDMKQRYGSQGCYLLKINSRTSPTGTNEQIPDPWSQYLHKNHILSQVSAGLTLQNMTLCISPHSAQKTHRIP